MLSRIEEIIISSRLRCVFLILVTFSLATSCSQVDTKTHRAPAASGPVEDAFGPESNGIALKLSQAESTDKSKITLVCTIKSTTSLRLNPNSLITHLKLCDGEGTALHPTLRAVVDPIADIPSDFISIDGHKHITISLSVIADVISVNNADYQVPTDRIIAFQTSLVGGYFGTEIPVEEIWLGNARSNRLTVRIP